MKKLLIIALAAHQAWQRYGTDDRQPMLYDRPYVAVYGRAMCTIHYHCDGCSMAAR